ncbi:MAG: hypothetical protein ACQESH_06400 [Campylobacterota bacterium]
MSILLFIVAAAVFIVILFAVVEDQKQRLVISGFIVVIALVAGVFNYFSQSGAEKTRELASVFEQNQPLQCGDIVATKENFVYDYPTQSLMGQGEYKGTNISIGECQKQ